MKQLIDDQRRCRDIHPERLAVAYIRSVWIVQTKFEINGVDVSGTSRGKLALFLQVHSSMIIDGKANNRED